MRARRLEAAREAAGGRRKQLIEQISEQLEQALSREGIQGAVIGREKHLYSIYSKMREKRKSFSTSWISLPSESYATTLMPVIERSALCIRSISQSLVNLKITLLYPRPMVTNHCIPF